jgi:hypothetical protein
LLAFLIKVMKPAQAGVTKMLFAVENARRRWLEVTIDY